MGWCHILNHHSGLAHETYGIGESIITVTFFVSGLLKNLFDLDCGPFAQFDVLTLEWERPHVCAALIVSLGLCPPYCHLVGMDVGPEVGTLPNIGWFDFFVTVPSRVMKNV